MSTRTEIFEKVLEKLKIREPVPDAVIEFVLYNKPKSLISALKAGGEYSIIYNFTLKVYYSFGKAGIGLSIAQSKIILGLAALVLAASVSAGAAVANKYLINAPEKPVAEKIQKDASLDEQPNIQEQTSRENDIKKEEISPRPNIKSPPKNNVRAGKTREFKKLSVVYTKDGKKYTGSFRASGKNLEVITTEGKIIIPSENIKSIAPYKGD